MDLLPSLVRSHALHTPGALALIDGAERATYAQLWERSASIAEWLIAGGLQRGDRVATLLPASIDAVAAIYATWLAGGVVVPLNTQGRAGEVASSLAHADARVLLHESSYAEREQVSREAPFARFHAVSEAHLATPAVSASPRADLCDGPRPADLAMILYTSGTTGKPKGVMLSHANLAANVASIVAYLELSSADRVLSVLPFYYSYGSSVLHTHLAVGASVVLEKNFVFPHVVLATMARERVTGFSGVPSTYALLLSRVRLDEAELGSLRYLTQAGAAMAPATVAKVRAALPRARLFVMYGQTEATARLTYVPPGRLPDKPGSVGVALEGVEIRIGDEHGREVPRGIAGSIRVRGPNVMLGYWRDEAATRQVLRDGWLDTGDIGYLDAEGFLFLSGRRTDIIKTGAHRVHPQEIEEVLLELEGVREAAVVAVEDELLGQAIGAYVVRGPDADLSAERIKAHCRSQLAAYKVPKRVEFVTSLPRTASGKLKRKEIA